MAERESLDIVQYLPWAARPDGAEAKEIAKVAVGAILVALWPTGNDWPAQRETIVRMSGIARPEMVGALDRLRRGERAGRVLDDRFDTWRDTIEEPRRLDSGNPSTGTS